MDLSYNLSFFFFSDSPIQVCLLCKINFSCISQNKNPTWRFSKFRHTEGPPYVLMFQMEEHNPWGTAFLFCSSFLLIDLKNSKDAYLNSSTQKSQTVYRLIKML